ncbi:hypothetical protein Tco_1124002 [Tanacetum coccineum]|uniref:Uncharacterized protein n=1 Tax=Tanacetum coccineum TaxID=301880 RepID=A0ABQ5J4V9_9ASTR
MRKKFSLEQPKRSLSGEARYLTPLWVSGNEESREELRQTDSSNSKAIIDSEVKIDNSDYQHTQRMLQDKIRAVLKFLTFRKQRVIVQFWSPHVVGKRQLLTTIDQPFGLGVIEDQLLYRKDYILYIVDKDHDTEEDIMGVLRGLTKLCTYRKYSTGGHSINNISASSMSGMLGGLTKLCTYRKYSTGGHSINNISASSMEKRQQSIEAFTFAINQTVGRVKEALEKHQPPSPGGDWPTEKQQVGADDIASEILQTS